MLVRVYFLEIFKYNNNNLNPGLVFPINLFDKLLSKATQSQ